MLYAYKGPPHHPSGRAVGVTRLESFILRNLQSILREWEQFARTRIPAGETMSLTELRDHAEEMLRAIAQDLGKHQTETYAICPASILLR